MRAAPLCLPIACTHTLSPFLPSLVPSYLPRCRPRGGRRGGGTLCGSAWSETSFPFHLMLPRGPKEAYLRARARAPPPLSSLASQTAGGRGGRHSNRPADRRFGGRGRGRANCAGSCPRAGGREGGREGARSVSQSKLLLSPLVFACTPDPPPPPQLRASLPPSLRSRPVSASRPSAWHFQSPPPRPPFHSISFQCVEGEREKSRKEGRREGGKEGRKEGRKEGV